MAVLPYIIVRTHPNIPNFRLKFALNGVELPVGVFAFPMVGDKEDFEFTDYIRELIGIGIVIITKRGIEEFFYHRPWLGRKIIRAFNIEERTISLAKDIAVSGKDPHVTLVIVDIIGSKEAVEVGLVKDIFEVLKDSLNIKPIKEFEKIGDDKVVRLRITLIGSVKLRTFIHDELRRMSTGMGLYCVSLGRADVLRTVPEEIRKELLKYLGWTVKDYEAIAEYKPEKKVGTAFKAQYGFAPVSTLSDHNRKQIMEFIKYLARYAKGQTVKGEPAKIYYAGAKVEIASIMETELFPFFVASVRLAMLSALELARYLGPAQRSRLLSLILELERILATIRLGRLATSIVLLAGVTVAEFLISVAVFMLIEGLVNYIISQLSKSSWGGGS